MPLQVSGQLNLQLAIDGNVVPLSRSAGLQVFINQNCSVALPSIKLQLPDFANIFPKTVPINDGSQIVVQMNDDLNAGYNKFSNFFAFGTPRREPAAQMMSYIVPGLLNAVPYLRRRPTQALTGTSTAVLGQIAAQVGLNLITTLSPNDKMMWLPGRNTFASFVNHIVTHSFVDATAVLTHGVDELQNLMHINVHDKFANGKIAARIVYGGPSPQSPSLSPSTPIFYATQYKSINSSGIQNHSAGYGLQMNQSSVLNGGTVNKYSKITAMTMGNALDISQAALTAINQLAKITLPPLDTGNTHAAYLQAMHQNQRGIATYSQDVWVLVPNCTGLKIFDMVSFEINTSDIADPSSQGIYCITNMTRACIGTKYYEKLQLCNQGPSNSNTQLVGG